MARIIRVTFFCPHSFLSCCISQVWGGQLFLILRALICQVPHEQMLSSILLNICHSSRRCSTLNSQWHLTVQLISQEQTASPSSLSDQMRSSCLGTFRRAKKLGSFLMSRLSCSTGFSSQAEIRAYTHPQPQVLWVLSLWNSMGKVAINSKVEYYYYKLDVDWKMMSGVWQVKRN